MAIKRSACFYLRLDAARKELVECPVPSQSVVENHGLLSSLCLINSTLLHLPTEIGRVLVFV
jgi:hypothetical protein